MASVLVNAGNASNASDAIEYQGKVLFGSSAITSQIGNYATWTRTGTGAYDIAFTSAHYALLFAQGAVHPAAAAATLFLVVTSTSSIASTTAPKISVELRTAAGTATDPTSGDYCYWKLVMTTGALNASR